MIAAVSFLDDIFSVPFWIRLAVHFLSAGAFVYSSGHYYVISPLLPGNLELGSFAPGFTVLFIVWTINAFNFMDGIDGIAGTQGVGAAFGWMLLGISSAVWAHANLGAILVGSCAAFLLFNLPPAKVFMGDVGSTFLGFTFAVFPLIAAPNALSSLPADILLVVILLWLFLFDTVFTRVQLVVNRRNFWKAHREHHYQRVVESGRSHLAVSLFFGGYAVACALALASAPKIGSSPLTALLIAGPAFLLIWPRMSRSA